MSGSDLVNNAERYGRKHGLNMADQLGAGTDGTVWKTDRNSAVKAFQYQKNYRMELACYQRLTLHSVYTIRQFAVPRLLESDDELLVVEMSIVVPPYLIDFGKAYLDCEPQHSAETWEYHNQEQRELWEENYEEVQKILWELRQIGIFYRDAKPGNIMFAM